MATILRPFRTFSKEAAIIGTLLAGYTSLEIDLMICVQEVRDDFDAVLKAMFRGRSEKSRIEIADALGRHYYHANNLGTDFEMAVSSLRTCMSIRNQYAHCAWFDDNSGHLAFANLEEIAQSNQLLGDLSGLTTFHVDLPLLEEQEAYFVYTESLFRWIDYEGRRRAGKPSTPPTPKPRQIKQPPLHIP